MIISVLGPQGSGKTTQAKFLAKKLKLPLLMMGDLFRKKAEEKSPLGKRVKDFISTGRLVPSVDVFLVLEEALQEEEYGKGFILDGFPRSGDEHDPAKVPIDKCVYLSLPDEVATQRLLARGREDDTPVLIKKRLKIYHEKTEPLLELFREEGKLIEVDASGSIEETKGEIERIVVG